MAQFSTAGLVQAALGVLLERAPKVAMSAVMGSPELRDGLLDLKAGAEDALAAIARETHPDRLLSRQGALLTLLERRKNEVLAVADRRRMDPTARAFLGSALDTLATVALAAGKAYSVG